MSKYISIENLRFVLFELLEADQLFKLDYYKDLDKDSVGIMMDAIKDYADKKMYPCFKEMDAQPAIYQDGKILVHPAIGTFMKDAGDNGWIGPSFSYENGGMQLPYVFHTAASHIMECANNNMTGYTGLTGGAANLIATYGTQELNDRFVPNMLSGKWGGTMCLTEPQAGSSLSDIATAAIPQEDGTYKIKGQKIFISGGDHEYCENFIHLVLARIEGAPGGTKGISLFVVPKNKIEDQSFNDVITAGEFQKMGQKGYCTTHLVFGENDNCIGHLVGEENHGLKNMFQMMNGARIDVGMTAASVATAAFYASLQYAQERSQGRRILKGGKKNVAAEQTAIINHPDVKRMLLLQKAVTEGAIATLLQASLYHDLSVNGAEEEREKYHLLLELLTPIAKTYPSEMGRVSISNGLQILGGYGFCTEFVLEQYYRDIRIMSLYEGTTGIQSLDLLGRKVIMKNGESMKYLTKEIIATIKTAQTYDDLKPYAERLKLASKNLEETLMYLLQFAMSGDHERYIADATIFMEFMSNVVIGWQWLKMATTAKTALLTESSVQSLEFYESKIHTMKFFYKYELSKNIGLKETLMHSDSLTILEERKSVLA